jgi:N6-L-threonylcarbamoyladenine synthase
VRILGIETSCDETSAAVVVDGRDILSNVVQSQIDIHRVYGGVVPEIACRAHIETIYPVVEKALEEAQTDLAGIGAIAVTSTPGLVGALLVGVSMAKSLALAGRKPILGVDHIHGHMYAVKLAFPELSYPCIHLVVSGGHTSLYRSTSEIDHELLGSTTDDAAGEAFDKVAKILELGFPGGPRIDAVSEGRNPGKFDFKRTVLETLDFSFSGLKTAVLYRVRGQDGKKPLTLSDSARADVAAGFQEAVVDVLVEQSLRACQQTRIPRIAVGGGVACNSRLRVKMKSAAQKAGLECYFPPARFCTDNAAMIAGIGYPLFRAGRLSDLALDVAATKAYRS